jgi:hypothetical protein
LPSQQSACEKIKTQLINIFLHFIFLKFIPSA